jgi:uncharacterized OB-fold protein
VRAALAATASRLQRVPRFELAVACSGRRRPLHEDFRDRLPYNVALVQLDEGPSLITNILADNALLRADARVRFVPSLEGERTLARFELVSE